MKKNKYFFTFLIIICCFLLLGSNCYASIIYKNPDNEVVTIPDAPLYGKYTNYFIYYSNIAPDTIYCLIFDDSVEPYINDINNAIFVGNPNSVSFIGYPKYIYQEGQWKDYMNANIGCSYSDITIIATTKDIYNNNSHELVFQQTPMGVLAQGLKATEPVQMFQTMTHGMIIFLLVFLIGLVGFWKAWSLLLSSLHKA